MSLYTLIKYISVDAYQNTLLSKANHKFKVMSDLILVCGPTLSTRSFQMLSAPVSPLLRKKRTLYVAIVYTSV